MEKNYTLSVLSRNRPEQKKKKSSYQIYIRLMPQFYMDIERLYIWIFLYIQVQCPPSIMHYTLQIVSEDYLRFEMVHLRDLILKKQQI